MCPGPYLSQLALAQLLLLHLYRDGQPFRAEVDHDLLGMGSGWKRSHGDRKRLSLTTRGTHRTRYQLKFLLKIKEKDTYPGLLQSLLDGVGRQTVGPGQRSSH